MEIISKLRRIQEKEKYKKELRTEIDHIFAEEDDNPIEPIISMCHQHIRDTSLTDVDVTILVRTPTGLNERDISNTYIRKYVNNLSKV